MSYVIDRNGQRKEVPAGYILQSGERHATGGMSMMDGAPPAPDTQIADAQKKRDDAYQAMCDRMGTAYRGDDVATDNKLPAELYAALPSKHRVVFAGALADVAAAKGRPERLRTALEDLRRHSWSLLPAQGAMTTDEENAVGRAHTWILGFCDSVEKGAAA